MFSGRGVSQRPPNVDPFDTKIVQFVPEFATLFKTRDLKFSL